MKKILSSIICAFMMGLSFAPGVCYPEQKTETSGAETEEFDFANGLFSRGMYDMAIKGYEKFIEKYPGSQFTETAVFRTAESYFLSREYEAATGLYKKFIEDFPSSKLRNLADLRLAQILLEEKKYKDSEQILLRIAGINPSADIKTASEYYLARVYLETGKTDQAKKIFKEIISGGHDAGYVTFAYINLGELYLKAGDAESASKAFSGAFDNAVDEKLKGQMALRAGEAYSKLGRHEEAKKFYRKVIDNPVDPGVFDNAVIGFISSLQGNKEFSILIERAKNFIPEVNKAETKARLYFIIGNRYFNMDNFSAAREAYSEAIKLFPDQEFTLMVLLNECWALYRLKQYGECLEKLETYLKADSGRKDEAMYIKARVLADKGRTDEALVVYKELQKKYPNSAFEKEAGYQIAWIHENRGEKLEASEAYLAFIRKYPGDKRSPTMLLKSAQDNYELKRYAEAVEGYNMFLEKYPRDPLRERVVYQLGNIYLEQGKTEKGIEIFEGFLNSFLHSKAENYVLFSLGRAYQKREEWDKAIARYNRILEDEKSSEDKSLYSHVLESLAFCYFKKGSRDRAAEEYFKLISRIGNADVPESVFLWLADYYWSIKDNDKSISVLKIFNQRYPGSENSAEVDYLLAKNYMDRGDVEETIRYFNSAISSKAPSPYMERSFLGLGQVYSEKGEYDKSLSYLEKAIEGNQDNRTSAFARFEIGNVYSSKKIYEEAAKQYMMVAILYDDKELCPAALYQAGISFSKAGKDKESDEAFKELIERYPGAPQAAKAEQYVR